jgi:hypothetical protein
MWHKTFWVKALLEQTVAAQILFESCSKDEANVVEKWMTWLMTHSSVNVGWTSSLAGMSLKWFTSK